MSWCHDNLGGRAFYTALGHESHLYQQEWFRTHLLGGILTAAKQVKAGCRPRQR
jgi:type 1 glutamine amidotransferase